MLGLRFSAILAIAMSLLAPPAGAAAAYAAASDEPHATLRVMSVNGSGCLPGSSTVEYSADGTGFTLHFADFAVSGRQYKSCVAAIQVDAPAGWTYAIYEVQTAGYGVLDSDASGRIMTDWWFTGYPWTMKAEQSFTGPFDDFWRTAGTTSSLVYAPCGTSSNVTINSTLRVTGPSTSVMELHELSLLRLVWQKC